MHWIVLWTDGIFCENMDSYGLPLKLYPNDDIKHWQFIDSN